MHYRQVQRFLILLLAIAGFMPVWAQSQEKIRIGWVYAMANAPVLIAEQQNLFAKHGVTAELQVFNSGPLVMRAFEAGDLDMAYIGMPPLYLDHDKGGEIAANLEGLYDYMQRRLYRASTDNDQQGLKEPGPS